MKNSRSCGFRTSIGGQALIEGILMRGPKKQAIVCRTKDGLVEKTEELKFIKDKYPVLGWPLIRGCAIFLDSMVKGMQALTYSASLVPIEEQGEPDKLDKWIEDHFPEDKAHHRRRCRARHRAVPVSVHLPAGGHRRPDKALDSELFCA